MTLIEDPAFKDALYSVMHVSAGMQHSPSELLQSAYTFKKKKKKASCQETKMPNYQRLSFGAPGRPNVGTYPNPQLHPQ